MPKELEELAGFSEVCKPCFVAGGDLWSAAWGQAQEMLYNIANRAVADFFAGEEPKEILKKATIFRIKC